MAKETAEERQRRLERELEWHTQNLERLKERARQEGLNPDG